MFIVFWVIEMDRIKEREGIERDLDLFSSKIANQLDLDASFVKKNLGKQADLMVQFDMSPIAWLEKMREITLQEMQNNLDYLSKH